MLISLVPFVRALELPTCTLTCDAGQTCYAKAPAAQDCLESMPLNKVWANNTLDVLMQSLENFGFSALYHATGPPYSISMDVEGLLAETVELVDTDAFPNDFQFQEHVQTIFQRTIDAHTRYSKPKCYGATFLQPFAFDLQVIPDSTDPVDDEPKLYLMKNLYTEQYQTIFSQTDLGFDLNEIFGKEVSLLNGVEFTTEISSWGDSHETRSNNRGVRFNAAFRSYLYRSAISYNVDGLTDLTVTTVDGVTYTLPWLAVYAKGFADVSTCVNTPASSIEAVASVRKPSVGILPSSRYPVHEDDVETYSAPMMLHHEALTDSRPDRTVIIPANDSYLVSCFVQTVQSTDESKKAKINKVLVMKVASFSPAAPEGEDYLYAWNRFLGNAQKCLSAPDFDMIVVDVMQNGGGYVCLGLRLLELLVEDYENDHTKVQMNYDLPHSKLMDQYINVVNAPDPYPYPEDVEQILNPATQQSYVDGKAYYYPGRNVTQGGVNHWRTNFFALDCRDAEAMPANNWRPPKFMPKDKLIILSDGTCGSTCASFTKIPQEHDKATFVGAGGLWNENMDVASFAGGFVCNPGYLQLLANLSGTTFPNFLTNQRWQFGWATWYSAKLPTRQIQFTEQTPTYRQAFWGFPHASISSSVTTAMVSALYDQVIASSITRLAIATPDSTNSDSCALSDSEGTLLIAAVSILGAFVAIGIIVAFYVYYSGGWYRSKSVAKYGIVSDPLLDETNHA